ncbi:MAG: hypothetical protein FWE21_06045 [Defluviitaleaceae bacterium]|nr:hypothetical protein [Defluviitaleaceae bacterium]
MTSPNRPTSNIYLRRAMAYAINQELINQYVLQDLRFTATSIITPMHGRYMVPIPFSIMEKHILKTH